MTFWLISCVCCLSVGACLIWERDYEADVQEALLLGLLMEVLRNQPLHPRNADQRAGISKDHVGKKERKLS